MTSVPAHGGNRQQVSRLTGIPKEDLLDFSANINPLGFPEWLRPLLAMQLDELCHYPDPLAAELTKALAAANGAEPEQILVTNGASEALHLLPAISGKQRLLLPVPCYLGYARAAEQAGMAVETLPLDAESGFVLAPDALEARIRPGQLVMIGQPNNPTGTLVATAELRRSAERHPETLFVIDESFIDFVGPEFSLRRQRPENVVIVQSLTKSWGIPGLRLGFVLADSRIIAALRSAQPTWSVNGLAQAVGLRALEDGSFLERSRQLVGHLRQRLKDGLERFPQLTPFPGEANFLLVRVGGDDNAGTRLAEQLGRQGVMIRDCGNFAGLDGRYVRIAVRGEIEQQRLFAALEVALQRGKRLRREQKTPAIMFQGTSSNVGKSVLTAALCRILRQDGVAVAPFKAQNMSLNSFVTVDGREIGRAQAVQAQACRLEPDVRMNPVLLKPCSDTRSQVIVRGRAVGNMDFRNYATGRDKIFAQVRECYDSLAREHRVMVLEGAGSPAEINLKDRDIVNMNMACHAVAQVLLVGDIDRGGVFAALLGTLELLSTEERARVAGLVINRFRGDAGLLWDGLEKTAAYCGKPFLGVVPYLPGLGLPEEDSVDFKAGLLPISAAPSDKLDIAVIDLPHISNFTDLDALRVEPDVYVRKVVSGAGLGAPDLLILPGSKNVIGDLQYLHGSGLAAAVQALATTGRTEIAGLCGGYQMLGTDIADPHAVESSAGRHGGLAVLPLTTVLQPAKLTTRCRAVHLLSGESVEGYEIHHGTSANSGAQPLFRREDGSEVGHCVAGRDWLWGTYLHGVFDADPFRRWLLDRLRQRKGWAAEGRILACYNIEAALDELAGQVRAALDMTAVYRLLGL